MIGLYINHHTINITTIFKKKLIWLVFNISYVVIWIKIKTKISLFIIELFSGDSAYGIIRFNEKQVQRT